MFLCLWHFQIVYDILRIFGCLGKQGFSIIIYGNKGARRTRRARQPYTYETNWWTKEKGISWLEYNLINYIRYDIFCVHCGYCVIYGLDFLSRNGYFWIDPIFSLYDWLLVNPSYWVHLHSTHTNRTSPHTVSVYNTHNIDKITADPFFLIYAMLISNDQLTKQYNEQTNKKKVINIWLIACMTIMWILCRKTYVCRT